MRRKRATRHCCNNTASSNQPLEVGKTSISEFERGSQYAAIAMAISFLIMALGCWWFGW